GPRPQRVHQRDLGPAEAGGGHGPQLAVDLAAVEVGAEPPPAHHRPGGRIGRGQSLEDLVDGVRSHGSSGQVAAGGAQRCTASSRAQLTPSSLNGRPAVRAERRISSIPSTTGWAAGPSPTQSTPVSIGSGSGTDWMASSTAENAPVEAREDSSGTCRS